MVSILLETRSPLTNMEIQKEIHKINNTNRKSRSVFLSSFLPSKFPQEHPGRLRPQNATAFLGSSFKFFHLSEQTCLKIRTVTLSGTNFCISCISVRIKQSVKNSTQVSFQLIIAHYCPPLHQSQGCGDVKQPVT